MNKIKLSKPIAGEKLTTIKRGGGVVIGNIKKERVWVDQDGNEVKPFTKQIIKRNTN